MLGVGKVIKLSDGMCFYHINDIKNIEKIILPIFNNFPLLTSKYYDFLMFKQAVLILNNKNIQAEQKDIFLINLKNNIKPENYISPAWSAINYRVTNLTNAKKVMTKS